MWPVAAVSAKRDEIFELVDFCKAKIKKKGH